MDDLLFGMAHTHTHWPFKCTSSHRKANRQYAICIYFRFSFLFVLYDSKFGGQFVYDMRIFFKMREFIWHRLNSYTAASKTRSVSVSFLWTCLDDAGASIDFVFPHTHTFFGSASTISRKRNFSAAVDVEAGISAITNWSKQYFSIILSGQPLQMYHVEKNWFRTLQRGLACNGECASKEYEVNTP